MRLKVWGAMLVLIALAAVQVARAATVSVGKGRVGGPPTIPVGKPVEGEKLSPALVIGRGRQYDGPMEIVAFNFRDTDQPLTQYCSRFEYLATRDIALGPCGADPEEQLTPDNEIQIDCEQQRISPKNLRWTEVGGRVAANVARVRVRFHRFHSSRLRHIKATVARVSGPLQQKLGQPVPFGVFDARVPGLVPFLGFRTQALDANGNVIGVDRRRHPRTLTCDR